MLSAPYLFSIDLEDVRSLLPDGHRHEERVPSNTERILRFLADRRVKCTFFTTGDVARRYPSLVRTIATDGHEIACHSSDHTPLPDHTPESFHDDLSRCAEDFAHAGVAPPLGFRAPYGSMVRRTTWAYAILKEFGYRYSASVLPAANPIYGWPDYGPDAPRMQDGMPELPVSMSYLPGLNVPFTGGVYFRVLPLPVIRRLFRRRLESGQPVVGYLHPFDFDFDQERFPFPGFERKPFFNWLMYKNRDEVFDRLAALLDMGAKIVPYIDYVKGRADSFPRD